MPFALARIPSATGSTAATWPPAQRASAGRSTIGIAGSPAQIGPKLRERGMLFVGLDVIGGFVTEINVTSPTGVREIDRQFGTDIAGLLMDAIARRLPRGGLNATRRALHLGYRTGWSRRSSSPPCCTAS